MGRGGEGGGALLTPQVRRAETALYVLGLKRRPGEETARNPAVLLTLGSSGNANVPLWVCELCIQRILKHTHTHTCGGMRKDETRGCLPWQTFEKH